MLNFNKFDSIDRLQRYLKSQKCKNIPHHNTIMGVIKRFKQTGSIADLPRTGRTKILMMKKISDSGHYGRNHQKNVN